MALVLIAILRENIPTQYRYTVYIPVIYKKYKAEKYEENNAFKAKFSQDHNTASQEKNLAFTKSKIQIESFANINYCCPTLENISTK